MPDNKIHVYLMPGMAANSSIFNSLNLPQNQFETHKLDWFIPQKRMSLQDYAKQMLKQVHHENPVLLGVSFGGLLVQEMAKMVPYRKVIVVSSVKCKSEMPRKMIFAKYTKAHKLLPTGMVTNIEVLARYAFGETVTKRLELYEKYLSMRDKKYIDWAIDQMVNWEQTKPLPNTVHIHGTLDNVFPISIVKNCIPVKNGKHAMIVYRTKWFNEHLPAIILEEGSSI
ncbi:YqiA/YcfP family alpha/beta fold hydrolase [Flagellimonas sp. S174]|uniref:YqiA/YcfP family alpha/beta fold hydrolase n=1 Tax=Flagellimonas sp. S174 TaxID=3410790 RepID=UPI003BF57932